MATHIEVIKDVTRLLIFSLCIAPLLVIKGYNGMLLFPLFPPSLISYKTRPCTLPNMTEQMKDYPYKCVLLWTPFLPNNSKTTYIFASFQKDPKRQFLMMLHTDGGINYLFFSLSRQSIPITLARWRTSGRRQQIDVALGRWRSTDGLLDIFVLSANTFCVSCLCWESGQVMNYK